MFECVAIGVTDDASAVAEDFFDFTGDLTGLVDQPEGRVDDGVVGFDETPGAS
jgi:hypothetical protein